MRSQPSKPGLTRVEVIVILLGLLMLGALLLPAIQSTGRHNGRTSCRNNLKCVVLALQTYHEYHRTFPMGAMHAGPSPGGDPPMDAALGPSWWFGVLPFLENRVIHDQIMQTQRPGGPERHEFCADDMNAAGVPLDRFVPEYMRCSSSSLPLFETAAGPILLPSYVGIAGGCDIDPDSSDFPPSMEGRDFLGNKSVLLKMSPQLGNSKMRYHNKYKGTSAAAGIVTASGMLPPCQHVRKQDCTDGTSNVAIVAEQSDWLRDQERTVATKYHGDPGWTVGGTGPGSGFLSGTTRADPVPRVAAPGGPPAPWGADCWNITTVRYRPHQKWVMGTTPWPGCSENHGINNPLQSPHPGGLQIGLVDGSVQFLSGTVDLAVVLRLAIRDDGQPVEYP